MNTFFSIPKSETTLMQPLHRLKQVMPFIMILIIAYFELIGENVFIDD